MRDDIKQRLKNSGIWGRALFMLLFIFIQSGVKSLIILLAIFQSIATVLAGETNSYLIKLGQQLAKYDYQINLFLTFNSEQHPFPFSAWPVGSSDDMLSKPENKDN